MRSKTETAQTEENGRKRVVKLGMKAEQRDGIEYELTTVLDLIHDGHFAVASKDRTGLFVGDPAPITEDTGARLLAWLENGAEPEKTAADLAISLLEDANDADDFRSVWETNKGAWHSVMPDAEYSRTVAAMKRLATKWAPAKEREPA